MLSRYKKIKEDSRFPAAEDKRQYPFCDDSAGPMRETEFTKNAYGVVVRKACCSCAYKELTRLLTRRRCKKHKRMVSPDDVCGEWKMREELGKLKN